MRTSKKFIAGSAAAAVALSMAASGAAFADTQSSITDDNRHAYGAEAGDYVGRFGGIDRFGTAISTSKGVFRGGASDVIIANYMSWADVLSAAPLADVLNAPILFTRADRIDERTKDEIERLGASNVWVIGGEGVVTSAVINNLKNDDALNLANVRQIGGSDRYETSHLIAALTIELYGTRATEGTSVVGSLDAIASIKEREAAYQNALAAYEAARQKEAAAQIAKLDADAKVAAITAQIADLVAQVEAVGVWTEADQAALEALQAQAERISTEYAVAVKVAEVLPTYIERYHNAVNPDGFEDGTIAKVIEYYTTGQGAGQFEAFSVGGRTYSTIDQVFARFVPVANFATVQAQDIVDGANRSLAAYQAQLGPIGEQISELLAKKLGADEATGTNAEIYRQIAALQGELAKAKDAQTAANAALAKAQADLAAAKTNLDNALAARPNAADLALAERGFATAVANSIKRSAMHPAFLASGSDYADALSAGPAAAKEAGVVLLTRGARQTPYVQQYIANKPLRVAVGGEAAAAIPSGEGVNKYWGANRYETAVKVAEVYFGGSYNYIGLASGEGYADAVVAGAALANLDSTIVLTRANSLPAVTENFLRYNGEYENLIVFGGHASISDAVRDAAKNAIDAQ